MKVLLTYNFLAAYWDYWFESPNGVIPTQYEFYWSRDTPERALLVTFIAVMLLVAFCSYGTLMYCGPDVVMHYFQKKTRPPLSSGMGGLPNYLALDVKDMEDTRQWNGELARMYEIQVEKGNYVHLARF
mmetsp:Transcript_18670/g.46626  ORF Transcript_18670/g.46626 Transcript_18670/m.46626 type:complete len:129 (-) Transcript_18670:553-939(-)|eukprot:CAMPEP_0179003298 /NCGR_PEP_ID=MMETSP0795-20121207/12582_1 /TAXON_ID=88552 /ORGANISM="Amoebophrya sp., Strain Ameob2" /LENGTH=128 /DNA_ID=CAMNT_0020697255 /DNA_START=168 /DNA_END=554 /DNA_ORIENTATION=+